MPRSPSPSLFTPIPTVSSKPKLAIKPYRLYSRHELPKSYELDDWESEDDQWFKRSGIFYNVREFCTVGMPKIKLPRGGAQTAGNGMFRIAAYEGEIYAVVEDDWWRSPRTVFVPSGKRRRVR